MKKSGFLLLFALMGNCIYGQFERVISTLISPETIHKTGSNRYLIDFGKASFGTLNLYFEANPGDSLVIHLGEKLDADFAIDKNPGGTIRYKRLVLSQVPLHNPFTLPLPPDGRNDRPPAVLLPDSVGTLVPFRYCEIENLNIPIESIRIRQQLYHYPFDEEASYFYSSDTVLNQIWDLCKHTIKATSFLGVYIDGDRERIPYEADAYINQLSHYAVDREYGPARETITHFMDHPTWPTEWLLHTLLMVYQDYKYTGNQELIRTYYEPLKSKTLYELADIDGLISSFSEKIDDVYMSKLGFSNPSQRLKDIVDWPPAQKDTGWQLATAEGERDGHEMRPINTVVNCFFYENMRIMAKLAAVLEKSEDVRFFEEMAKRTKSSINEKLLDSEQGRYRDGIGTDHASLHSNMMALAFDLVPQAYLSSVVDYVKSRGMACSVYGAQYLLEGLFKAGASDYALNLITTTDGDRNWWNMIRSGSTMAWEAWDMRYKPNLDWNHAWGTAPLNIIPRYVWGITPDQPGFEMINIQPQMGRLTTCSIKVPTPKGPILADFQTTAGIEKYTLELPPGTVGKFIFTPKPEGSVSLNGQIQMTSDFILLEEGKNTITIDKSN
jgi:hypothetical protein